MTSGAWPGHQECVKSPDVPDVDLGCSTGLVSGVIGATGSEPFPQAHRRRICFGTSDCWEGQVQEAAPEIWPLLTPPSLPPPRGAHQPQPLWGLFRSSCHVELAPSPGPCFPSAGVLTPWPWCGCFILPSRPPRAPRASGKTPGMSAPRGQGSHRPCSPCPPRSSVKKQFFTANERLGRSLTVMRAARPPRSSVKKQFLTANERLGRTLAVMRAARHQNCILSLPPHHGCRLTPGLQFLGDDSG